MKTWMFTVDKSDSNFEQRKKTTDADFPVTLLVPIQINMENSQVTSDYNQRIQLKRKKNEFKATDEKCN